MSAVQAFLTQAPLLRTPHPLAVSRTFSAKHKVWHMTSQSGEQGGVSDGFEIREPTLEESLDAIDDVFMNRRPDEGESFHFSPSSTFVSC